MPDPGAARSFWLQEALAADPGEPCPPLASNIGVDVAILGGGFAGLWTAIELSAREPALRIALIESDICGGGASGRNGGFFASSWWDLPGLCGLFGEEPGIRYATALADEIYEARDWCEANDVDAWFHIDGVIGVRAEGWQDGIGREGPREFCAGRGLADRMRALSASEARAYADSPRFTGGSFIPDSATVQPARLARGLRRVALERGVNIFERTRAIGFDRGRPCRVSTEHGAVRAEQVVITTGSWAAEWREFSRSFGGIVDYVVATEPIPDLLKEIGWNTHVGIGDGRDLLYYLRKTDDDRIVIGGGNCGVVYGGRASARAVTHDRSIAEAPARGLGWMFPQLEGVRFTHAWGGPIDQTASFTPFFRTLEPGNIHAGLGFSGHGLAQTKIGGKILASKVLGVRDEWIDMPVNAPEVAKAPGEPLRWPLVKTAIWALRTGDLREENGRRRGWIRRAIGSAPIAYRDRLARRGPKA